jgi:hypothetical protein
MLVEALDYLKEHYPKILVEAHFDKYLLVPDKVTMNMHSLFRGKC